MIKVLVVDDSALMRKLLGKILPTRADFEVRFARNGLEALEQARQLQARRRHARHPHAADGRAGLPGPHHGRAALSGGDGVVADRDGRGSDAGSAAAGRGGFHRQARRRGLAAASTTWRRSWWPRSAPRPAPSSRPACGCRSACAIASAALAPAAGQPAPAAPEMRRSTRRSGDGLVLVGTSTGGPPALEALLTALPPNFPGRSWSPSTCRRASPGPLARRLDGLCALARDGGAAADDARRRAAPISAAATPT